MDYGRCMYQVLYVCSARTCNIFAMLMDDSEQSILNVFTSIPLKQDPWSSFALWVHISVSVVCRDMVTLG